MCFEKFNWLSIVRLRNNYYWNPLFCWVFLFLRNSFVQIDFVLKNQFQTMMSLDFFMIVIILFFICFSWDNRVYIVTVQKLSLTLYFCEYTNFNKNFVYLFLAQRHYVHVLIKICKKNYYGLFSHICNGKEINCHHAFLT